MLKNNILQETSLLCRMRFPLALTLANLLADTLLSGVQIDHALHTVQKQDKRLGSKDRKLLALSAYSITRNLVRYQAMLPSSSNKMNDAWNLIALHFFESKGEWPSWDTVCLKEEILWNKELLPYERLSISKDLYEVLLESYSSSEIEDLMGFMDKEGPVYIRLNTLKASEQELKEAFSSANIPIQAIKDLPTTFELLERRQLLDLPAFQHGWFEIQDVGSQKISRFLGVDKGEYLLDACAGSCGKSLAVAAFLENQVHIIAHDIDANRLKKSQQRISRSGANIQLMFHDQLMGSHELFDKVLIDAPCSGAGTIKRKPQLKSSFTSSYLNQCLQLQKDCLRDYTKFVKIEGEVVYATCSILKQENDDQVNAFLSANPNFELIAVERILPNHETDGFFMAKMKRNR